MNTEKCRGTTCGGSTFDFKNIRYFCEASENFYCVKCSTRDWVYETKDSKTKERLVCRAITENNKIKDYEKKL